MKTSDIQNQTAKMMAEREKYDEQLKAQFAQLLVPSKPLSPSELDMKIEALRKKRVCEDARLVQQYFPSQFNKAIIDQCEQQEIKNQL